MPSVRGEVMWKTKARRPFLAFTLLIQVSNSILVNHTIDDSLGDLQTGLKVQYFPLTDGSEPVWKSQDTSNDTCFVNPDPTEAHFNTWSSASCSGSDTVSATFSFHGTAIYIYFIISSCLLHSGFVNAANCDFWVDGQFVGNYMQFPAVGVFGYNTLVYANDSLSNSLHTFAIQPRDNSFLIFDYAEYTTDLRSLFHWVLHPHCPSRRCRAHVARAHADQDYTARPTSNASVTSPTAAPTRSLLRLTSNASIASMTSTNSIANTMSTSGATSPTATPTRSSTHTGVIVGGTVAGVAGIALVLGVILYRRRALLSDAPTISTVLPRKPRSGHVSPFMLAGPPGPFHPALKNEERVYQLIHVAGGG
ncbi:hypothetical protein BD779DRAFT_107152 [Infundibulicybe gibba]|nr:hypothetical protein BD779DRAFT_107152 [Infundibulicybe gibba]